MKSRKLIITLMYSFVGVLFFDLVLTGQALLNLKQISDVLDLLKMDHLALVRFFKVVMDYSYNIPRLIIELIKWIPISTVLLLVIFKVYTLPVVNKKYKIYFWVIPMIYLGLSLFIGVSLSSTNPAYVMQAVKIAGYITFGLASLGLLTSICIIFCFLSHLIDVRQVIDYNEK